MLKTRIITAVCLLAVFLSAVFYLPPKAWHLFCSLICALAAWEWGGLAGWGSLARIIYAAVLGITLLTALFVFLFDIVATFIAAVFWLLIVPFWLRYKWPLRKWNVNAALVGFIVNVPPAFVLVLSGLFDPLFLILMIAVVWVADISAYFTGRAFGGKKLAPDISPGKTWAGAVGAVIGVLLYCNTLVFADVVFLFQHSPRVAYIFEFFSRVLGNFPQVLLLQFLFIGLAVMSIVGDLFE